MKFEDKSKSLPDLTSRIEKEMHQVENLHLATFSLTDLDSELVYMAMICSLPAVDCSFLSSLVLLPQVDFKTLREAFILEGDNRRASISQESIVAATNLTHASRPLNKPSTSSTNPTCEFFHTHNHTQAQCFLCNQFQAQACSQAQEAHSNHHQDSTNNVPSSASKSPATTSSDQASVAQSDGDTQEYVRNASTLSFDSSSPCFSDSLCWCADTGASSHMTPWYDEYTPHYVQVHVANGTVVRSFL